MNFTIQADTVSCVIEADFSLTQHTVYDVTKYRPAIYNDYSFLTTMRKFAGEVVIFSRIS